MKSNMKHFLAVAVLIMSVLFTGITAPVKADEGMWLMHLIDKQIQKQLKKEGLKINPKLIYDESSVSLSDAVVALDFGCTGSIVSEDGLLITNHHCAYSDVHELSTPDRNYLEDGFWASTHEQEIPIPGKSIYFLKRVIDVTDAYKQKEAEYIAQGKGRLTRRITAELEREYATRYSGLEASLASIWRGEKYYMYFYRVYKDVRLVAAPPVSIGAYGGDIDNWRWPQHKGDFALYRIYTAPDGSPSEYASENIPLVPETHLKVSTKGVKPGDFTMVIGFPGSTSRYASSYDVNRTEKITNPVNNLVREEQLRIINQWMNKDPLVRLKYADYYFSISNVYGLQVGEVNCYRRYGVVAQKSREETALQQWIDKGGPQVEEEWKGLLPAMADYYEQTNPLEKEITYYRETYVRGTCISRIVYRVNSLERTYLHPSREVSCKDSLIVGAKDTVFRKGVDNVLDLIDMRVEKDLFAYSTRVFFEKVERPYWGDEVTRMWEETKGNVDDLIEYIWNKSVFTDIERLENFINEPHLISEYVNDPLCRFYNSVTMGRFNEERAKKQGVRGTDTDMERAYTHALYTYRKEKGALQYPDANSTMRFTYGTAGPLIPSDAIYYSSNSTTQGVLDKYNPDQYEFTLKPEYLTRLQKLESPIPVNFLSDNDITGGNSGSPVLNGHGELIGLAFDGNLESLSGDTYFHPDLNKCVSVDIRYVLWILDFYAPHLRRELCPGY